MFISKPNAKKRKKYPRGTVFSLLTKDNEPEVFLWYTFLWHLQKSSWFCTVYSPVSTCWINWNRCPWQHRVAAAFTEVGCDQATSRYKFYLTTASADFNPDVCMRCASNRWWWCSTEALTLVLGLRTCETFVAVSYQQVWPLQGWSLKRWNRWWDNSRPLSWCVYLHVYYETSPTKAR